MLVSSVTRGSLLNLLVVHKWYSSSHGGLALKFERYSWYQWDGAAVVTRVISVFRGQLYSGWCLFMCHSRNWSRHCHCCCWCVCYCYCSCGFFFISFSRKNAKGNHKFLYITGGENIAKVCHTNQLKPGLKYKLLLKYFQNPSLLKDWVKSALVFENIRWLYFSMSLPQSLVMREPVVPSFVPVSVLKNPSYCFDFVEFYLCFDLQLPLREGIQK